MSNFEKINPGTPVAGPYSPGMKAGNTVYISGQVSIDPEANIREQTLTALNNVKKIVKAAGGEVSNIINTTVFLTKIEEFGDMNVAYKDFFNDNGVSDNYPSRATVEVSKLPRQTMLIEISAIAVL
ncbi:MAG: RidA family protein [Promethearchaeota archaeon]